MATMKIKKGDTVQVLTGKDKGATGKVIAVNRETGRVVVEGGPELALTLEDKGYDWVRQEFGSAAHS